MTYEKIGVNIIAILYFNRLNFIDARSTVRQKKDDEIDLGKG